jgi:hypothetical protein
MDGLHFLKCYTISFTHVRVFAVSHHHHHIAVAVPRFSLLRLSALERLGGVAIILCGLWGAVWWALS